MTAIQWDVGSPAHRVAVTTTQFDSSEPFSSDFSSDFGGGSSLVYGGGSPMYWKLSGYSDVVVPVSESAALVFADYKSALMSSAVIREDLIQQFRWGIATRYDVALPSSVLTRSIYDVDSPFAGYSTSAIQGTVNSPMYISATGAGFSTTNSPITWAGATRYDVMSPENSSASTYEDVSSALYVSASLRRDVQSPEAYGITTREDVKSPVELVSSSRADVKSPTSIQNSTKLDYDSPFTFGTAVTLSNWNVVSPLYLSAATRGDVVVPTEAYASARVEYKQPLAFGVTAQQSSLLSPTEWLSSVPWTALSPAERRSAVREDAQQPAEQLTSAREDFSSPEGSASSVQRDLATPEIVAAATRYDAYVPQIRWAGISYDLLQRATYSVNVTLTALTPAERLTTAAYTMVSQLTFPVATIYPVVWDVAVPTGWTTVLRSAASVPLEWSIFKPPAPQREVTGHGKLRLIIGRGS